MELHIDDLILRAYTIATPAPILSDERLNYLADAYQSDPDLRDGTYFDFFVSTPGTFLGGVRPIEFDVQSNGEYRRLLPEQRRVAAIIDRPFLLNWLGMRHEDH